MDWLTAHKIPLGSWISAGVDLLEPLPERP